MRHRKLGRQFSRNTSHRRAMFRALTANLVLHERIETTDAKAKELRRVAERLISQARRLGKTAYTPWDKLSTAEQARRQAAKQNVSQFLRRFGVISTDETSEKVDLVEKVFSDLAKRYEHRPGGYTRIIKLGPRRGDAAPMCLIELVEPGKPEGKAKASPEKDAPKAKAPAKPATKAESAKAESTKVESANADEATSES